MNKDEALKMAIEVMQAYNNQLPSNSATKAINACKEALERPAMTYEQGFDHGYEAHRVEQANRPTNAVLVPLDKLQDMQRRLKALEQPAQEPVTLIKHENGNYSPKHQWQGLTSEDINKITDELNISLILSCDIIDFVMAIEQALKEKNT
jgi:hypothetical protein